MSDLKFDICFKIFHTNSLSDNSVDRTVLLILITQLFSPRFYKKHQIVAKSKMRFLDKFTKQKVMMIRKIFLQLQSDILSEMRMV
nr:hypothetical protein [Dinophyceae sp. MRD-151]